MACAGVHLGWEKHGFRTQKKIGELLDTFGSSGEITVFELKSFTRTHISDSSIPT